MKFPFNIAHKNLHRENNDKSKVIYPFYQLGCIVSTLKLKAMQRSSNPRLFLQELTEVFSQMPKS